MFIEKFTLYGVEQAYNTKYKKKNVHIVQILLFVSFLFRFSIFDEHVNFI